jgi:hypothetical protein
MNQIIPPAISKYIKAVSEEFNISYDTLNKLYIKNIQEKDEKVCQYVFTIGKKKGKQCDTKTKTIFCFRHKKTQKKEDAEVEQKNDQIDEKKCCQHLYVKGKKKGQYCSITPYKNSVYCGRHKPKQVVEEKKIIVEEEKQEIPIVEENKQETPIIVEKKTKRTTIKKKIIDDDSMIKKDERKDDVINVIEKDEKKDDVINPIEKDEKKDDVINPIEKDVYDDLEDDHMDIIQNYHIKKGQSIYDFLSSNEAEEQFECPCSRHTLTFNIKNILKEDYLKFYPKRNFEKDYEEYENITSYSEEIYKFIQSLKKNRLRQYSSSKPDEFKSIIKRGTDDIKNFLNKKGIHSIKEQNRFLRDSLTTIEKRILQNRDYMPDELSIEDANNMISAIKYNNSLTFNDKIRSPLIYLTDVKSLLTEEVNKRFIYVNWDNQNNDYAFYEKNESGKYMMDTRLENFITNILGDLRQYTTSNFIELYNYLFGDNQYVSDFNTRHLELHQLFQNVAFLQDEYGVQSFIIDHCKNKCKYTPNREDKFNLKKDCVFSKNKFTSLLEEKDYYEEEKLNTIARLFTYVNVDEIKIMIN